MPQKNKTRKPLTESDLFSIVESTEAELLDASKQLAETSDKILDGAFNAISFNELIKGGSHQASTVLVDGKPAFVIIHARNAVGWLMVDGAVKIGDAPLEHLFEGGYAIAKHFKCPQIVFVTKLKSLFRYAVNHDFNCLGVMLCKAVPQS